MHTKHTGLPAELRPATYFPAEELQELCRCPVCAHELPIAHGVVYRGEFGYETENGIETLAGAFVFCSLWCVLLVLEPEGNA